MVGHIVYIRTEEDRGDQSTLSHPMPHVLTRLLGRLEERFDRRTPFGRMKLYGLCKAVKLGALPS